MRMVSLSANKVPGEMSGTLKGLVLVAGSAGYVSPVEVCEDAGSGRGGTIAIGCPFPWLSSSPAKQEGRLSHSCHLEGSNGDQLPPCLN